MDYIVAVAAYGLYAVLGKKLKGEFGNKIWYVRPLLLVVATASLAASGLGALVADWGGAFLDWVTGLFGLNAGAMVAGVIALILIVGTALDLKDKKPDGFAKTGLILLPFLVMIATGPIAAAGEGLFDGINGGATTAVTNVTGAG